jgi:hypothetical protein
MIEDFARGLGNFSRKRSWGFAPNPTKKLFEKSFLDFQKLSRKINELLYALLLCSAKLSMGPLPHLLARENGLGLCHKPRQKTFEENK